MQVRVVETCVFIMCCIELCSNDVSPVQLPALHSTQHHSHENLNNLGWNGWMDSYGDDDGEVLAHFRDKGT